jgi:hypothetical protein
MQSAASRVTSTRRIATKSSHNTRQGKRRGAVEPEEHPLARLQVMLSVAKLAERLESRT